MVGLSIERLDAQITVFKELVYTMPSIDIWFGNESFDAEREKNMSFIKIFDEFNSRYVLKLTLPNYMVYIYTENR